MLKKYDSSNHYMFAYRNMSHDQLKSELRVASKTEADK